MRKVVMFTIITLLVISGCKGKSPEKKQAETVEYRRISVNEYVDKMKAGWVGQMAGVGWGGPTEFRWKGDIIPEDKMPKWKPGTVNQFGQDDIYVEMTFLQTLEEYGLDVSIRQAGIDFANSGYRLWHANKNGRDNLRRGIAPPDSGHPKFSKHSDDIDYQIEADYSGLIAPGMPNVVIELGDIFGRLMNYGDGLYGGQFVGGMYAEAFFENDIEKIIAAGLKCIPKQSLYHECITDVVKWYKQNPDDWEKTWKLINAKYHDNPDYRRWTCDPGKFNIDAKINGAYIVMGLLYGQGDPDKTIIISTRCGQDSDCNPSNAGGVLFTTIGFSNLPERFTSAIDPEGKFSHTPYNFPKLIAVCEKLARDGVKRSGGSIEKDSEGNEVFVIPVKKALPSKLSKSWAPGPIASSKFTVAEMAKIYMYPPMSIEEGLEKIAPGWKISNCGDSLEPGLHGELRGRKNVLVTHPAMDKTACVLSKEVDIPAGKKTVLKLSVSHYPGGDWDLVVKVNGRKLMKRAIGKGTVIDGWADLEIDLSKSAGKKIELELLNQPSGWKGEAAYWQKIEVESK